MKKSTIWILTIVMAVALLGLLFVQIMYIENMIKMRNEQFSEVVMRSLYNVATNLERDETKYFLDQDLNEAQASLIPFSSTGVSKNGFGFNKSTPFDTTGSLRSDDKLALGDDDNLSGLGARQSRQEILKGQYI